MQKSPRKKSATPSRLSRRNGARQGSIKREPPEIDLSAIRPPSPTEDPLLLSARRAGTTRSVRVVPVFSTSPPLSTNQYPHGPDTQWDVWTDSDSEGEGEYTGRFKMFNVPTKADTPTSETKTRKEWGRPVSPFPYEARLDRSLPDPQHMDITEYDDGGTENILDTLDFENMFEDIPPASDHPPSDQSTSDFSIGAEEVRDLDIDVDSDVIQITGSNPKAAARAAAILRLHDYDCIVPSKSHTTFDFGKQGLHASHNLGDRSQLCEIEDIIQDKTFIERHTPAKSPSRTSFGSEGRPSRPSSSAAFTESGYKPKAGEWRREDWRLLDKCFLEESRISGVMVAPHDVDREAVVMRFKHVVGGDDVVMRLGSPWSWENLLARTDVLIKKRATRTDISTLSCASFMSRDLSILANVTPPPLSRIPRYRDLLDEANTIGTNFPVHAPLSADRSQPIIATPNRLAEKTGFLSRLSTWTSSLPLPLYIKPDEQQGCPPLPPPPTDVLDRRKPIITPARKPLTHQKPHKDLVDLHHTSPPPKRAQRRKSQPKRLVDLRHISPKPLQRIHTDDRRARRSSGGSVKELIQSFEVTTNNEPTNGRPRRAFSNTLENRLA